MWADSQQTFRRCSTNLTYPDTDREACRHVPTKGLQSFAFWSFNTFLSSALPITSRTLLFRRLPDFVRSFKMKMNTKLCQKTLTEEKQTTRRKTCPSATFGLQISHGLTWDWNTVFTTTGQRAAAWDMSRPLEASASPKRKKKAYSNSTSPLW
jgi:hypothetical protein